MRRVLSRNYSFDKGECELENNPDCYSETPLCYRIYHLLDHGTVFFYFRTLRLLLINIFFLQSTSNSETWVFEIQSHLHRVVQ